MEWREVKGKQDKGDIRVYALSTCIWCQKAKNLIETSHVTYKFVYVDHLDGAEREEALEQMQKYTSNVSFPVVVIDEETVIQGYKEEEIRSAIGV